MISRTLLAFFSIVFCACSFFISYRRVPHASSTMPKISFGFMFSTFVMCPYVLPRWFTPTCMIRKWGLLTFSWTL